MAAPRQQVGLLVSAAAWAWAAAAALAQAQPTTAEAAPDNGPKVSFQPSVAIVVGIFTMIFSLTFLLLMYAKFCSSPTTAAGAGGDSRNNSNDAAAAVAQQAAAAAGVPKAVIESLPFFRFSTLRGSRQGMECSVCLARFDDADLLRLLPHCRHAFHLACVDRWLQSNASCPLCRTRVGGDAAAAAAAAAALSSTTSGRFRLDHNDEDAAGSGRDLLDIFVERVPPAGDADADDDDDATTSKLSHHQEQLDRHKHRIIVSDAVFKSRWSELNSEALLALDAEMLMLRSTSSGRFYYPDSPAASPDNHQYYYNEASSKLPPPPAAAAAAERKRLLGATDARGVGGGCSSSAAVDAVSPAPSSAAARMISSGVRSMSEIVSLPRLRAPARDRLSEEENRSYQRWLPIARRTARWFAGRSRGQGEGDEEEDQGAPSVHVVAVAVAGAGVAADV